MTTFWAILRNIYKQIRQIMMWILLIIIFIYVCNLLSLLKPTFSNGTQWLALHKCIPVVPVWSRMYLFKVWFHVDIVFASGPHIHTSMFMWSGGLALKVGFKTELASQWIALTYWSLSTRLPLPFRVRANYLLVTY